MEVMTSTIQHVAMTPSVSVGTTPASTQQQTEPKQQATTTKVSEKEVQQAIAEIISNIAGVNESIGFGYEEKLGQLYVLVTDKQSSEVIREVPSKDFIKHKLAMQEMIGLLLDRKA